MLSFFWINSKACKILFLVSENSLPLIFLPVAKIMRPCYLAHFDLKKNGMTGIKRFCEVTSYFVKMPLQKLHFTFYSSSWHRMGCWGSPLTQWLSCWMRNWEVTVSNPPSFIPAGQFHPASHDWVIKGSFSHHSPMSNHAYVTGHIKVHLLSSKRSRELYPSSGFLYIKSLESYS